VSGVLFLLFLSNDLENIFQVILTSRASVCLQMIVVNLKHLLNMLSSARLVDLQNDYPNMSGSKMRASDADTKVPSQQQRVISRKPKLHRTTSDPLLKDQPPTLSDKIQRSLCAAKAILSLLVTENDVHAISIRTLLQLEQSSPSIALGMRGYVLV
jgi:hypothetical protein